ncbi:terminase small subunit [Comamonas testosteroni]|uniref:Terminase small subunit n=1 Tax=Comamonas testosteroni TaxID=285 RepID=A0A096GPE7_COMTE|nr:terminase small subunit [Comamonas testosteroni]KGH27025.1 hypothetical protein P353_19750 [Comamonas testosteroni]
MALTPKQERFVAEYLIDLNATQAAIRARYSARTAASQGERLLRNVEVDTAIKAAMKAREQRTHITQDRVLQELARIAFFDIRRLYRDDGTMKDPHEMDSDTAAAIASIEVKEEMERSEEVDEELEDQPHGGALKRRRGNLVAGYTLKTKVFDKGSALQLAMRHLGMLNDKIAHTGPTGGPVETITRVELVPLKK